MRNFRVTKAYMLIGDFSMALHYCKLYLDQFPGEMEFRLLSYRLHRFFMGPEGEHASLGNPELAEFAQADRNIYRTICPNHPDPMKLELSSPPDFYAPLRCASTNRHRDSSLSPTKNQPLLSGTIIRAIKKIARGTKSTLLAYVAISQLHDCSAHEGMVVLNALT